MNKCIPRNYVYYNKITFKQDFTILCLTYLHFINLKYTKLDKTCIKTDYIDYQ
jgi:hypothetical protein